MKKSFAFPIIFMSLVTAVFVFVLAFLNESTAEQIEFLANTELQEKILYVFDIPLESDNPDDINKQFEENVEVKDVDNESVYLLKEDNEIKAYAYPFDAAGLWGSIQGYTGVSSDYSEIVGIEFISHSETPGLGGRIDETWYKDQFRGIDIENKKDKYIVYPPSSGANVDAITGATSTSNAVRDILNENIDNIKEKKLSEEVN